jgi:hypothetical protein
MRLTSATLFLALAAMSCRGESDDNNGGTPDARIQSGTADAAISTDAPVGMSIKSINMGAEPAFKAPIIVDSVVVVARVTSRTQGNVWVQDQGGGEYSGIHVFCSFTSSSNPCVHNREFIDGLVPGDVISISGAFSNNDFQGRPDDWEIMTPVITKKGTKMTPVALTVTADMVAKDKLTNEDYKKKLNATYVKIASAITISKFQAPEYSADCTPPQIDAGVALPDAGSVKAFDAGFEAKAGDVTIMIGMSFFDTLKVCLPDCGYCTGDSLLKDTDTFSFVQGIAYADRRNALDYVEIRPVTDADLPRIQ